VILVGERPEHDQIHLSAGEPVDVALVSDERCGPGLVEEVLCSLIGNVGGAAAGENHHPPLARAPERSGKPRQRHGHLVLVGDRALFAVGGDVEKVVAVVRPEIL